jgi:hypothetical protein
MRVIFDIKKQMKINEIEKKIKKNPKQKKTNKKKMIIIERQNKWEDKSNF